MLKPVSTLLPKRGETGLYPPPPKKNLVLPHWKFSFSTPSLTRKFQVLLATDANQKSYYTIR